MKFSKTIDYGCGAAKRASTMLLFFAVAVGCSHAPKQDTNTPTYQYELGKAVEEAAQRSQVATGKRQPASGASIAQFNRLSPGKFKVYVFPKLRTIGEKSALDDQPLFANEKEERFSRLGAPQEFEVSTIALNPCHQFIAGDLFAKLGAKHYFDEQLAEDKSRQCAIIEVTSMKIKNANRALIRRDDLLRMRLFLDDAYILHGYDFERHTDGQNTKVTRVKSGSIEASTSGLTHFPVDVPTLEMLNGGLSSRGQVDTAGKIDSLALNQVRKNFMRSFSASTCSGAISRYTDYFGSKVETGWCDGMPFPQYMENGRFVAITQPLSVR